ncbi:MAG TPA: succinyldiaminopimelate transaminase [Actinomycetes bacterium]|nr:succinyldiaminopimelate transaminase [Actinomycetes bacterium]
MGPLADRLPDFPWDRLAEVRATAASHTGGIVDLSIGTPVDPVPAVVQQALAAASDAPGYPTVLGIPELREAAVAWMQRRLGVPTELVSSTDGVLPAIGTKELVATLPLLLGLGPGSRVVVPELAYPTYEVGARVVGADVVATDSTTALGPARVDLVWVNSPSNPTGRVLGVEHLRKVVQWARQRGAVVVSDECYVELGWDAQPMSVLHPDVCDGQLDGVLALHSLSKRSNMAGYRAGFVAGDPDLVRVVLQARKHLGAMMPLPVQSAMTVALHDERHVTEQRDRYRRRRDELMAALVEVGFTIEHSDAGLYLWVTRDEDCWTTLRWFAERGVLVAPGDFYGAAGARHVRVALTASDERVSAAAMRIAA